MANTERIRITYEGNPSCHLAVIDPSKTCCLITTGLLKKLSLPRLEHVKDDKHSELHGDVYDSTVRLRARSELTTTWKITSFCVIKSDTEVIVLDKPLNPNHTQAPPPNTLPMANDNGFLDEATKAQIQANGLATEQENELIMKKIKEDEIERRKALDKKHPKKT